MPIGKIDIRHFYSLLTGGSVCEADWGRERLARWRRRPRLRELSEVGLTGLEPVTLRLSSACSNQLSYRPKNLARLNDLAI
jgi:hypothetical protein